MWVVHQRRQTTSLKFFPHPATYLNARRWEDELEDDAPKRKRELSPLEVEFYEAEARGETDGLPFERWKEQRG